MRTHRGLVLALALGSLVAGCLPVGRTVFPSSGETKCFLDVSTLCVRLVNVETEGNCDFEVLARRGETDETISTHMRVNRGARVPVSFNGASYEIEVQSTTERILHSDEAVFVLYGPR